MTWLSDAAVERLRAAAHWPEFPSERYSIVEVIGRGGMGTVYAAVDTALDREVAIKVSNAVDVKERRQGVPGDREERRQGVPGDREERRQGVPGDREERRQGVPGDREERRQGVPGDREERRQGVPGDSASFERRLAAESRVLARLEHPGIVPVHDVGRLADGRLFYVMKRVQGRTLTEHLAHASDLGDRLRIFERICEAVAFAHARRILHRDLKPDNVMIGSFGEVMVMDWGVAKALDEEERRQGVPGDREGRRDATGRRADGGAGLPERRVATRRDQPALASRPALAGRPGGVPSAGGSGTSHGTVLGTHGFMAPEQARGDSDTVNERADVYSLGAILLALLANDAAPVRPGGTAASRSGRQRGTAPSRSGRQRGTAPSRSGRPGTESAMLAGLTSIPRPLRSICARALAADRRDRYTSAAELGEEIARYRAGEAVRAHPETALERALRVAKRYRMPILLVLTYMIMRALIAFIAGW